MLTVKESKNPLFLKIHDLKEFLDEQCVVPSDKTTANFFVIYLTTDNGSIDTDDRRLPLKAKTLYFLSPGQINYFKSEALQGTTIEFSPNFFKRINSELSILMTRGMFSPLTINHFTLGDESYLETERLLGLMREEFLAASSFKREVLEALLKVFLVNLSEKIPMLTIEAAATVADVDLVTRYLEMIHANFLTMKKVSDYADKLCISPNYLSAKVRVVTGHSARHYIQQRIVQEAKQQAENGCRTLKEVAYKLGFDDLSHFSKFFKKFTGTNFTKYKKSTTLFLS